MKRWYLFIVLTSLLVGSPDLSFAQSYDDLWKQVEDYQKKDLPKSVMQATADIYKKAQAERNLPQMIKAYLVGYDSKLALSDDYKDSLLHDLQIWANEETNAVGKAVLNNMIASSLQKNSNEVDSVLSYCQKSLLDKEALRKVRVSEFYPMAVSGEVSKRYFDDTMYDLLVRRTIDMVKHLVSSHDKISGDDEQKLYSIIDSLYDDLIACYEGRNRTAVLLLKEEKLIYNGEQKNGRIRLFDEQKRKEYVDGLYALAHEFSDIDISANIYVKIANIYNYFSEKVEAMQIIKEGMEKYPRGEWKKEFQNQINAIERPRLNVNLDFLYPNYEIDLKVDYINLEGFTIDWYRLDLSPMDAPLKKRDMPEEEIIKKYGKKIDSKSYKLEPTADYRPRYTTFTYVLPEAGIYMIKQTPKGKKGSAAYSIVYVSPFECIHAPVSKGKREFIVVDKLTGQPVSNAEFMTYTMNDDGYKLEKTYQTDEKGSVVVPDSTADGYLYYNACKGDNDFMPVSQIWVRHWDSRKITNEDKTKVSVFTDRSLYRPGQIVHASGLLYRQDGDSVSVLPNMSYEMELVSSDGTVLEKKTVTTDEYGVCAGDFVLSNSLQPADYYVSINKARARIKVEEYKLPTFDVEIEPYTAAYSVGDSITIEGKAMTFAGAPVRSSKVKYRIVRFEKNWWEWRRLREKEMMVGETTTDADGKFHVGVVLDVSNDKPIDDDLRNRIWVYEVKAEVTNLSNETQEGTISLSLGKPSIGLQIKGLDYNVMREKKEPIQFRAVNLNQELVDVDVTYRVYALDENQKKGDLKCEETIGSQRTFVPEKVLALPSGQYCMEVSTKDKQGEECTAERNFVLFSKTDTQMPYKTEFWFCQDGKYFDEENPATFYVGSSEEEVYLLINVYDDSLKRLESYRHILNNEVKTFRFPYKAIYGDGIRVTFAFLRKGRLYSDSGRVIRCEPEKNLTLKWETFRDKLQAGETEEWSLQITDKDGKPVKANLMATLHDNSLNRLCAHKWRFHLSFYRPFPIVNDGMCYNGRTVYIMNSFTFNPIKANLLQLFASQNYSRLYSSFQNPKLSITGAITPLLMNKRSLVDTSNILVGSLGKNVYAEDEVNSEAEESGEFWIRGTGQPQGDADESQSTGDNLSGEGSYISLRDNFNESAFFYSNLRSDSSGCVKMVFTMPDALTEWKFTGFAHTKDVSYGLLTDTVRTSKQFMVQPNMPRFVRQGDCIVLTSSLINMAMTDIAGTASLELINPINNKLVYKDEVVFNAKQGETGTIDFEYNVPTGYELLVCKIVACSNDYSDGEQHYLPILTDKQWMVETIPVQMDGEEIKDVETGELFNKQSETATEKRLTIELTANPDWFVVQALPVVANPAEDDALSWAVAYYANEVASAIIEMNPNIKRVFDTWIQQGGTKETFLSNLERNQDLKTMLLEETPWVSDAVSESEQRRRVALLFDMNGMNNRVQQTISKLQSLQMGDGSWSWFKGMNGSRYITTSIVELLARLKAMHIVMPSQVEDMYTEALEYLKKEVEDEYDRLQKEWNEGNETRPSELVNRYLYICAIDKDIPFWNDEINNILLSKIENHFLDLTIYGKAQTAVTMNAYGETDKAADLIHSLKEYVINSPEMGSYFDSSKALYGGSSYKIASQVAAMEAIMRVEPDEVMINGMKQWLLKQKQVQAWSTPVATADAIYAFLCMNGNRLNVSGKMYAKVGRTKIETPDDAIGYTREILTGAKADVQKVRFSKTGEGIGWGAVYAQYFEDMDAIQSASGNGLRIVREYYRDGKKISAGDELHAGDRLTVRLAVTADRDMDFVQIKDERAACMEPVSQISGYRWINGLGCHYVNKDASTSFFIDKMRKGSYLLTYDVYIDRLGTYQAGVATIQSVYAPEFTGHTEGMQMTVKE